MKTYKIDKKEIEGMPVLAGGYKVIKWDSGTLQSNFKYGAVDEVLEGTIWKVDGDIEACKWGLHFSRKPEDVFNFYEALTYNRYFKVRAYGTKIIESGNKIVVPILEFTKELTFDEFIEEMENNLESKGISWSKGISQCNGTSESFGIYGSKGISKSKGISRCDGISRGYGISRSSGISKSGGIFEGFGILESFGIFGSSGISWSGGIYGSRGISGGNGISRSYGIYGSDGIFGSFGIKYCKALSSCVFCHDRVGKAYWLFNKKSSEERIKEIYSKLLEFEFYPKYMNWEEARNHKEWYMFNAERLRKLENPWSDMPKEMIDYLKSLPEFDAKVFTEITGLEA